MSEQVAAQLRDEIIAGDLRPGEPLRHAAVAERLGVSVTPVREALAALERQGLVGGHVHRGFRVTGLSPTDVADAYALHAFMAARLIQRATQRLDSAEVDRLLDLDREMLRAVHRGDREQAVDLNHEVHRRMYRASGSGLLLRFVRETTPFVTRRLAPDLPGWTEVRLQGHADILEAVRRGDGTKAAELLESHILKPGEPAVSFAEALAQRKAADKEGSAKSYEGT